MDAIQERHMNYTGVFGIVSNNKSNLVNE